MKRKYDLFSLNVITIKDNEGFPNQLICEMSFDIKGNIYYKEIFTNTKILSTDKNVSNIENLCEYYPPILYLNKNIKLTKKQLFNKYNELNKVEILLNSTDEIIESTLKERRIFEESKVYRKKYSN